MWYFKGNVYFESGIQITYWNPKECLLKNKEFLEIKKIINIGEYY